MRKSSIAAAVLGLTIAGGCNSFLDSPKAVTDPNNPTVASTNQLFEGVLANTFGNQEGPIAMLICQWMKQCAGVNGRFVETQGNYTIDATTFDINFQNIYNGGGLIGIRDIESKATAAGDKLYLGIAEVLEAMNMMFAADVWGDIPYTEAVSSNATPAFDGQMSIYASLLTLLDKAIADIAAGGTGPGPADLVYGGDAQKWTEAAHTLKARIYLHQVEKLGLAQYTSALNEAKKGISTPANDWKSVHSSNTSERNMWAQFANTSFGPDLVAGATLVEIMKAQNDPRIGTFFHTNGAGQFLGFDVVTGTPGNVATVSALNTDPLRLQPIITYDENQLIIAEAAFQTGDKATAAAAFNAERTRVNKPTISAAALTLPDIMTEKYIVLFQNPEVWNDYKRPCLPVLKPALGRSRIPGRIYYGITEEQTNSNTPPSSSQNLFTFRNANDPNGCQ
jgi:hypothetical protein